MKLSNRSARTIFVEIIGIDSPTERKRFLDEACGEDAQLRSEVESLLWAFENAGSFLDPPGGLTTDERIDEVAESPHPKPNGVHSSDRNGRGEPTEQAGAIVGHYKLLQKIGEGGFGVVYMAEQFEPVKRRVAFKIIKAGMDTQEVVVRFEAERQALAVMDHPHIAKMLDAGATDSGRPFFVMELVKGIPITDYCNQAHLDTRQRLALFKDVCFAIQHAHQKGVIHRDLKPSNIMVTLYGVDPVVKVIDFGIAKATNQKLTEKTLFTRYGQMIGTPAYMSPEQAVLSGLDVDTRSDIYSLGVLLYELLVGQPPFDPETLRSAGFDEMRRIIREQEPAKPSTKLSTLAHDERMSVASQRSTTSTTLRQQLRGDLDWIVLKAIDKDRTRRYESVGAFAADITRYLAEEPVQAVAPSIGYLVRKFARRHTATLGVAAALLLLMLMGVAATAWQAVRAMRAEQRTAESLAVVRAERDAKKQALADAEAVSQFLIDMIKRPRPPQRKWGLELTVAEMLDDGARALEDNREIPAQRRVMLQQALGATYFSLGLYRKAIPLQERVADYHLATVGPKGRDTLIARANLANSYHNAGRRDEALVMHKEVLALTREVLGTHHPDTLHAMAGLAAGYIAAGELDLAIPLLEQALEFQKAKLGADHLATLDTMNSLAVAYQDAGKLEQALPLFEEILKLQKAKLGGDHPNRLACLNNLAQAYGAAGKPYVALALCEETAKLAKAKLGPEHPDTLIYMKNLAVAYQDAGKAELALPLFEETLRLRRAKLGADHPATLNSIACLARAYRAAGKPELALPLFEETLKLQKAKLGADHPRTLEGMAGLAKAYRDVGELDLALPLGEETLKRRRAKLGADHPDTLLSMNSLAAAYRAAGKLELALPLFEETLKRRRAKLGADHLQTLDTMNSFAVAYQVSGKLELALPLFEKTLRLRRAKLGADHPETLLSMSNLAGAYADAGKLNLALPMFEEALRRRTAKSGVGHPHTVHAMAGLANAYRDAGKLSLARPLIEATLSLAKAKQPADHPATITSVKHLAEAFREDGKLELALPLLKAILELQKAKLGPDHPDTLTSMSNFASVNAEAGRFTEAISLARERLVILRRLHPPGSPQLARYLEKTSRTLLKAKAFSEAEPLCWECLLIREKALPDSWQTFNAASLLGGALLGQKNYADAEPLLLRGYEGMKAREQTIPAHEEVRLTESLERLVSLYESRNLDGDGAQAAKYQQLLKATRPSHRVPTNAKGENNY